MNLTRRQLFAGAAGVAACTAIGATAQPGLCRVEQRLTPQGTVESDWYFSDGTGFRSENTMARYQKNAILNNPQPLFGRTWHEVVKAIFA